MRILVAGGAGFIGSNLCERLLIDGNKLICVDNLVTGRQGNIAPLLDWPNFTFIKHDILETLPPLPKIGQIFHLASPASPPSYQRYAIETLRVNSEGTRRLLELAQQHDAEFLYCSTSESYGDPLEHPQREEYRGNVSSTGPRSMYDEAKRFGEALTVAYSRSRGVDSRIVRIFNTYGPRAHPQDGRMVPNFITQALRGEPITVYGNGRQTRSLCYVSDLVEGLVRAMKCKAAKGQVINLGAPEERTILQYADLILELTRSSAGVVFTLPKVADDPQRRQPCIDKARSLLGWEPRVPLIKGLRQTISYFENELLTAMASPGVRPS